MKKILTIFTGIAAALSVNAFASGGYECTADDARISLKVGGGLSHGIPSGPFNETIDLALKSPSYIAFENMKINKVSQFWLQDDELNVLIYNEPENAAVFSSIKVVINTKYMPNSADEYSYAGTYRAIINEGDTRSEFKGSVRCTVE